MRTLFLRLAAGLSIILIPALAEAADPEAEALPADAIVESVSDPGLSMILREVLERNPEIATARSQAQAALQRPAQARALPDPMTSFTAYLVSPETRVGPQQLMAGVSQKFPWFGKLKLREQAAIFEAAAATAQVEAKRLAVLTEARRLYYEIAFQDRHRQITESDRTLLVHYEEVARARYASGIGLEQAVIKIQAEITRVETRLLNIASQRARLVAVLNALRDRPQDTPVPEPAPLSAVEVPMEPDLFRIKALDRRPELSVAEAQIQARESRIQSAGKEYYPDFTVGLSYGFVGRRDDPQGIMTPPPDNGQNILGLNFGINIPLWREKLSAGVDEATEQLSAAKETKRNVVTTIDRALGDLTRRMPLTWNQLRLFEDVLVIQAEEALRSVEAAYSAGTSSSLELLDAERVLLEVRVSTARARTDYAIAIAQLEGVIADVALSTRGGEHQ